MNDDARRSNFGCVGARSSDSGAMTAVPQEISDEENGDSRKIVAQQPNRASPAAATELTPQKRPRTSGGGKAASQKKVVCQSVLEAHGLEAKVLVDITGWCVDLSEAKDIPGSRGVRKVMTLTLGDGQAVIMVSLWSPMVEKIQEQLGSAYDSAAAGCFPKVMLQNLETVAVAATPLHLMKLQSRKESTLQLLGSTAWTLEPDASVVMSTFAGLNCAHVTTSLRGTLMRLGAVKYSRNDLPMRPAIVMDGQKVGIPLMLTGWHAERPLEDGSEIAAFGVSSLPGLALEDRAEETTGYYWCYSENYLAVLQPGVTKPEDPVTTLHIS